VNELFSNLDGFYSRRITIQHRLIYSVSEKDKTVYVLRMWTQDSKLSEGVQDLSWQDTVQDSKLSEGVQDLSWQRPVCSSRILAQRPPFVVGDLSPLSKTRQLIYIDL